MAKNDKIALKMSSASPVLSAIAHQKVVKNRYLFEKCVRLAINMALLHIFQFQDKFKIFYFNVVLFAKSNVEIF